MTSKKVQKRGASRKGKAEGGTKKLTAEQTVRIEAEGEAFKRAAHDYAHKAYTAALAHYGANHNHPFALSRLAVVYGETKPGDAHMVVTLPGRMRDSAVGDEDVRGWVTDAELLARTLEHADCPAAFRDAFGSIFTEHMLADSGVSWTTPAAVRVLLPLVMLAGSGTNHVCDDRTALDILITLSSDLVDDATSNAVRDGLIEGK